MTEVWFRNPHNYIRELAEVGEPYNIVWDRGMLIKKRIEPVSHAKLYLGESADFDILCIGQQGTAHLDKDHGLSNPKAVYPTWEYGENFNILEEMVSSELGLDVAACTADIPIDERPVYGQQHRVVITNLPDARAAANRPFYRNLAELQEEYSNCIITLHGSYSYRIMFGMGFGAADVEPRDHAANGRVVLPNGKVMAYARTVGQLQWINLLNTSVVELKQPRNRCIFNIRSAKWAGEHFTEDVLFKSRGEVEVDHTSPVTNLPTTRQWNTKSILERTEGDMINCDTCTLADGCKLYREGAVCSVKGSETSALAQLFQSRDSGRIIDGLGTILAAQTKRLEMGMESEDDFGELDPEVTKIMNQLFANGVKLAKLVDPSLGRPLVQINNGRGGAAAAVGAADPKQLVAEVIRELESQGIKRENISSEMFQAMMMKMVSEGEEPRAIPGHVVEAG
jgi:hypothetical protein